MVGVDQLQVGPYSLSQLKGLLDTNWNFERAYCVQHLSFRLLAAKDHPA
jgi:hypothetical protein